MNTKRLFLFFLVQGLLFLGASAESSYIFHHLSTKDGLSNNSVKNILKDSYGFLWIGTEFGLNRYDGYTFKTYLANPGMPNTLVSNDIIGLQEDGLKNIWIDFGYTYVIYNREKDNFRTDFKAYLKKLNVRAEGDLKVYVDKNKNLCVISKSGIHLCDLQKNTVRFFKCKTFLSATSEIELSDDRAHLYYINYLGQCWQLNIQTGHLNRIDLKPIKSINGNVKIVVDARGGLWVYSSKDEQIFYRKEGTDKWKPILLSSLIRSQSNVITIQEGLNDRIYIATDHKGFFVYNKADGSLKNYTNNTNSQTSIASNNVNCILIDSTGSVWIGHNKRGLSIYDDSFQDFTNFEPSQCRDISKILELRNGSILFGTDGDGLFLRNPNTTKLEKLSIPNTAIVSMIEDKKGRVWIGTYQKGLFCWDHHTFKNFNTKNSNLSSNNIWCLREDRYGCIWIGTLGGNVHIYSPDSHSNFFQTPFQDVIHALEMDYDGGDVIYIGTGYGLMTIDIKTHKKQLYFGNKSGTQRFNQPQIFNLFRDSRTLLWLGTSTGLAVLDRNRDTIYNYSMDDGLCDNIIKGIAEDNLHNIWVTTSNGLSVLSVKNENDKLVIVNSKNFSVKDGLKSDYFNNHSICRLQNGDMMVGSTDGYTLFNPNKVTEKKQSLSKIIFTKVSVGNTQLIVDSVYHGKVKLKKSIELISTLNLNYNDKNITFEFTTVDLLNSDKVKYLYKIEGFNNQWIPTTKNDISLTALPYGRYKLLIKACNSDGIWNIEPKQLLINIAPPFYWSLWAKLFYLILAIGAVYALVFWTKRKHQRKLEQHSLQVAHDQEIRLNEMKLRFFTNISHDLRTPLTLIITPLQTLLKDIKDENLKKKLDVIHKNAQQLLGLINSLLDFRKLDAGAEVLRLKSGNLVELVSEIYDSFHEYAIERNIKFLINSDMGSLWLEYDSDKIYKSIQNLLSNAFKYTPGGGTIEIRLYKEDSNVCIGIADSGIGISDEDKKNVFNRFYQILHDSKNTGSGIGLHIASEYIKLHNGSITVTNNHPIGSVFTLRFPIIEATSVQHNNEVYMQKVLESVEVHQEESLPTKQVVLFVEDNKDLCEFIKDNLTDDYKVLIANDGQEAMTYLNQNDVNVVVSDIMMPVMDGIELCKRIKTNIDWSHIPVILLTAKIAEEHQLEGLEYGADDYITKPFNLDILKLRISKFIEWNLKCHHAFKLKLDINPSEITITTLDEKLIQKAIKIVEESISDTDFSVEVLCEALGLSRGHLYKKLMAITGKGPAEFIRTIRLKRGRQLLEKSQLQIAEIAYEVGFNSPKRFTVNFKEEFGMSPSDYLRQFK